MKTFYFTNTTENDFTCMHGNQKYTIAAGQEIKITEEKAQHFAKHLARAIARDQKITNSKTIEGIKNAFLKEATATSTAPGVGNIADLEAEAEAIEATESIVVQEVDDTQEAEVVIKKSKKKPAFE